MNIRHAMVALLAWVWLSGATFAIDLTGRVPFDASKTRTYPQIGLTVHEKDLGNEGTVLIVTESSDIDPNLVVGFQFNKVNNLRVYSYKELERELQSLVAGQTASLGFYISTTKKNETYAIEVKQASVPPAEIQSGSNTADGPRVPSLEYHAQHTALKKKAADGGYIYKNENYWISFPEEYVREIFEGEATGYHLDSPLITLFVKDYVRTVESRCSNLLGADPGVFSIKETTTTFNGFGNVVDRKTNTVGQVLVKRRFVPIYAHYSDVPKEGFTIEEGLQKAIDIATNQGAGSTLSDLERKAKFVQRARADLQHLFAKESCDSPVLVQFEENLYRYAAGQQTVAQGSIRIEGAAEVSDSVYMPGTAQTVGAACLAKNDFGSRMRDFCICQGKAIEEQVSSERLKQALENYTYFERTVEAMRTPQDQNLYGAMRRCAS